MESPGSREKSCQDAFIDSLHIMMICSENKYPNCIALHFNVELVFYFRCYINHGSECQRLRNQKKNEIEH